MNMVKIDRGKPRLLISALVVVAGSGMVVGTTGIQMSGEMFTAEPQLSGGGVIPSMNRGTEHNTGDKKS